MTDSSPAPAGPEEPPSPSQKNGKASRRTARSDKAPEETPMPDRRKLYRSRDGKMIAGVLSGFGEYVNVDASLLRIVYVVLTLFTGVVPGLFLYLLMMIIIPPEPKPRAD